MLLQTGDQSSRKYYYYRTQRPIGHLSETDMPDRRPRHASLETHLKPTCPSETDMLIAWSETDMPD